MPKTLNHFLNRTFLWLLLLSFSKTVSAQLHAGFTATPLAGCAPLIVNFTDQSTGNPAEWQWDLGNGTNSILQNPAATYFVPGQYNIKLVIRNSAGADSIVKTQYISVYSSPLVAFTGTPLNGCYPLIVQFTDQSSPGSGIIDTREWDFGDGYTYTGLNPQHTYTSSGNFNVSLRIKNSFGCISTITKTAYVQINSGVHAAFTQSVPASCTPAVSVNFQNQSTGIGTLNYQWFFGDGGTSSQTNPSHTYTSNGSYTVRLVVINASGCTDTLTKVNSVTVGTVQANFTVPAIVCAGSPVPIVNTSNPIPTNVHWDFGDGTNSTVFNPVKVYNTPGIYNIKLVDNFGACSDSITKQITVLAGQPVNFTADKLGACIAPLTVNFTGPANGLSYNWSFGDGTSSTQQSPTHTYTTQGEFTVTLRVLNASGCLDSIVKINYIKIHGPEITFTGLPRKACAPLTHTFQAVINTVEPIINYTWDFGDGTTSNAVNPTHTFTPGTYTIKLYVTTASGCTDSLVLPAGIRAGIKPVANFTATPLDVCAYIPINFSDLSTGSVDQWLWNFGDGGTSTAQNPSHEYSDTGWFDITLVVWNNGCADTIKLNHYLHIKAPIAAFTDSFTCVNPARRIFIDKSLAADTWFWEFGDGTTATIPSPVHNYAAPGIYTVKLTVTNFASGCSHTATRIVSVITEHPTFAADDTIVCRGSTVFFQVNNISPGNISSYNWNYGDGWSASDSIPVAAHQYNNRGVFTVSLITTNRAGCRDTIIKPAYIFVGGPTSSFRSPVPGTCINSTIIFTDSSYSDGTYPITNWTWNFGDGVIATQTAPPFEHVYNSSGNFSVSLRVQDSNNCADSSTRSNHVIISKPIAGFRSADTLSCPGKPVIFVNESLGPVLTYQWDFGDGTSSLQESPVHIYSAPGTYTVILRIMDRFGCRDSITKVSYIKIALPHASFNISDSSGSCPPLIVNFTNTSAYYNNVVWDFGDGTTSNLVSPTHFYSTPGTFTIKLTIASHGGCVDTALRQIIVRGPTGTFRYPPSNACSPLLVNFTAETQNSFIYVWDFNDGTTITTNDSAVSHVYSNPGKYLPKLILVDQNGCQVPITGPDSISVYGVDAHFNSSTLLLCDSGLVTFTNTSVNNDPIVSYQWDFGDGAITSTQHATHVYAQPGLYYPQLIVTTTTGCKDTAKSSLPVRVIRSPVAGINGDSALCVPAMINFTGVLIQPDTAVVTWRWDFNNGNYSNLQNPATQVYPAAGNYMVKLVVTNSAGCKDTVLKPLVTYPLPLVRTGQDTFICKGQSHTLSATGGISYIWYPSTGLSCVTCANPVSTPDSTTDYFVSGKNDKGCIGKDTVRVQVKQPFIMAVTPGDTICTGKSLRLGALGADSYEWSPPTDLDNPYASNPIASPSQTRRYRVIGKDSKGCFADTAYSVVTVYPYPLVNAGPDKTITSGQSVELKPTVSADVVSALWTPSAGIQSYAFPGIIARPMATTEYKVEVRNAGQCIAVDKITVFVVCNNSNVFIPNTFSPNSDGANDIFYIRGSGLFRIKTFRVFNRWGELVFEKSGIDANDPTGGWDGSYKGVKQSPDVFVYTVEVICDNSSILTYKGNVSLIQ